MTGHGIYHGEKAPLIAQRLGKLSVNVTAYWITVRSDPNVREGSRLYEKPARVEVEQRL